MNTKTIYIWNNCAKTNERLTIQFYSLFIVFVIIVYCYNISNCTEKKICISLYKYFKYSKFIQKVYLYKKNRNFFSIGTNSSTIKSNNKYSI